jgi:manganese/zinc/iron transport system permease protein
MDGVSLGTLLLEFVSGRHPFAYDATAVGILVGVICGLTGVFLVLRQLSLVGDAAGHATLPGVVGAYLLTGSKSIVVLLSGALASALLALFALAALERAPRTRTDASVGLVLSVSFGFGIVLLSYAQHAAAGTQAGLHEFLFGSAAAVTRAQLYGVALAAVAVICTLAAFFRPLALATFDPAFARSVGVPVRGLRLLLLGLIAVAVVLSIQAVGVVLVAAMLVIPPSAARCWTNRLVWMAACSATFGGVAGCVGALASYAVPRLATGPAMVLTASAIFIVSLLIGPNGAIRGRRA